jgi:c-di-GMP-binding flagellar brake protein YcgR
VIAKKDANKKHYFSTIQGQDVVAIMKEATTAEEVVYLWKKGQDQKDLEEFKITAFDPETFTLSMKSEGGFLAKLSGGSSLIGEEVFFKLNIAKFQFFSYSDLEYDKATSTYTMVVSKDFYKSQQRTNYRLMASQHIKIQLKVEDTVFDCLDLSAGGTSFIIEDTVKDHYAKGKEFATCILRFNKVKIDLEGIKIMGLWDQLDTEDKPTGEVKLGVAFVNLSKETEEMLFKEINGEARAEEIRKNLKAKKSPTSV